MAPRITCKELIGFLDDYVAGRLPPNRVRVFERHLRVCPACRDYLADYRASVGLAVLLRGASGVVPDSVPDEVLAAVRQALAGK